MNMKQTTLILFLVCVMSCHGQNGKSDTVNLSMDTVTTKNMKIIRPELTDSFEVLDINRYKEIGIMKKFDVETFKKNQIRNHYQVETEEAIILQWEEQYCFYEQIEYKKNPFGETFVYYIDTYTMCASGQRCYTFPVGISYEYDHEGNVTKETDWDKPFKFSLDDLRKKIMREYKVDIFIHDFERIFVTRSPNPIPHYDVKVPHADYPQGKWMTVDGTTGETISELMPDGGNRIINPPKDTTTIKEKKNKKGFWDTLLE